MMPRRCCRFANEHASARVFLVFLIDACVLMFLFPGPNACLAYLSLPCRFFFSLVVGGLSPEADDVATAASIVQLAMMVVMTLIEAGRSGTRRSGFTFSSRDTFVETSEALTTLSPHRLGASSPRRMPPRRRTRFPVLFGVGSLVSAADWLNFQLRLDQHQVNDVERLEFLVDLACHRAAASKNVVNV
ncbi:GPI-anchored surface protein, putative [Bodo saltans]|uniref:GPI-anchored surface protein, putative n=1 Tax=Bodo saltans TaxID=75058 RepID=A0A0S4IWY0_BODSA|nr:GPI-anchored surface protein, putative [Bodo saltans]|eukprot:CUF42894.1 GPI-anchored surface protein, putative [Bodo saltans]